jgi:protein phosphatase
MQINNTNCEYIGFSTTLDNNTISGFHKINQDCLEISKGIFGNLFIIGRGIGANCAEVVSRMTVKAIKNYFNKLSINYNIKYELENSIKLAANEVNAYLSEHNKLNICGASVAILLSSQNQIYFANAGDCRIYLIRDNKISLLSSEQPIESKCLASEHHLNIKKTDTPDEYNIGNIIGKIYVEPNIFGPYTLYKNDYIILSTKGLYQRITRFELLKSLINSNNESINKIYIDKSLSKKILFRNTNNVNFDLFIQRMYNLAKTRLSSEDFSFFMLRILKAPSLPVNPIDLQKEKYKFIIYLLLFLISLSFFIYTVLPLFLSYSMTIFYK